MVTSTKANSPVDIASRALILIGAEPITSFGDGTTESLITSNLYEDIAQTAISDGKLFSHAISISFADLTFTKLQPIGGSK